MRLSSARRFRDARPCCALLVDAEVDLRFARQGGDILAHRAGVAARAPSLALVMDLAAMADAGPRLVTELVEIPREQVPFLPEADYMVSLYNGSSVPRVRLAWPDGRREDALEVLRRAVGELAS